MPCLNSAKLLTGKRYVSPTAFTVAVKRQAPAGRQGNDGWRSVLYEGAPLERVRKAYASQFAPAADDFDEVRQRTFHSLATMLCVSQLLGPPLSEFARRMTCRSRPPPTREEVGHVVLRHREHSS